MRKLIACVFFYSLDGLLADEGTDYWRFAWGLPDDPAEKRESHERFRSADLHIMGRVAYQAMAAALQTDTDHPVATILTPAPKVVFSRTLTSADWPNTTIAAGDTADEIDTLRRGGDGHIVVWGGVSFWRSLMRLDLIDELHLHLFPYVAGEGTRLFDGDPASYQLDLLSSTAWSNGTVGLHYRRERTPPPD